MTRTHLFRPFDWQIQVRGALVAEGSGVAELVSQGLAVVDQLNSQGLTDAAGTLRELSLAFDATAPTVP